MNNELDRRIPTGGIDDDSDRHFIAPEDYIAANNVSNSPLIAGGAMHSLLGSVTYDYTFPDGNNTVVGSAIDTVGSRLIYFIANSLFNHQIVAIDRYSNVTLIARGSHLGFELDRRIYGIVLDEDTIVWTDAICDGKVITGTGTKSLSIEKARLNKELSWEIHYGVTGSGQFATGQTYQIDLYDQFGALEATSGEILSDGTYENDLNGGFLWLAGQINELLEGFAAATACDCKIKIVAEDKDLYAVLTSSDPEMILVPLNHYAAPYQDSIADHWVYEALCPYTPPVATYISVDGYGNNVSKLCAQFRVRYVMFDGTRSPWSPLSNLALNATQEGLNAIKVDFTDPRLSDPAYLSKIVSVEISFRDGNNSPFYLINNIDTCDLGIASQYIIFDNTGRYNILPSDDTSISSDTQILMNEAGVPRNSMAIAQIADDQGVSRLVFGGNLTGYNCPDCVDVSLTAVSGQDEGTVNITGTVVIENDPSDLSANPSYHKYPLGGFVVYLAGTPYFGISNNPSDGTGDGSFTIFGVPRGVYAMRVAHYLCGWTDENGKRHNLNNGLEWQKTSAPTIDVAGGLADNGFRHERTLDLRSFTGPTFDLDTETGYGTIRINNAHATPPGVVPTKYLLEVYVKDNDGKHATLDERNQAQAISNQTVSFYPFDPTTNTYGVPVTKDSDHNGYAAVYVDNGGVDLYRCYIGGVEDVPPASSPVGDAPPTPQMWIGHWGDIESDVADSVYAITGRPNLWNAWVYGASFGVFSYPGHAIAHIFNGDTAYTPTRLCRVHGKIIDSSGSPVAGALLWMVGHGPTFTTGVNGQWELFVWGPFDGTASLTTQFIYATLNADIGGDYPIPAFEPDAFGIDYHFGGLPETEPVLIDSFVLPFSGYIGATIGRYKSGGVYEIGIVYEDQFMRNCGVVKIGKITIPFHTEDGDYAPRSIKYQVNHAPPTWAVRYRFVRTIDGLYQSYNVLPAQEVLYAQISDDYLFQSIVPYGSGLATHILLQIPVYETNTPSSDPTLVMYTENNPDGYRTKLGDRVRMLLDNEQQLITSGLIDLPVLGEYVSGDKLYAVVPNTAIGFEVKDGSVFEFYTPKGISEALYFETGDCLDILSPGSSVARHAGGTQDQIIGLGAQPAEGNLSGGDTYWRYSNYMFKDTGSVFFQAEHDKMRDSDIDPCEDIGRVHLYDPYAEEVFRYNEIRISGSYIPNSGVKMIRTFGSTDHISINRNYGPIHWIGLVGDNLLVLGEFDAQPVYVGRDQVMDLSGNFSVGRSARLLTLANSTATKSGTVDPLSVVVANSMAFWWDQNNGKVWRYGQDGVTNISTGREKYFLSIANSRKTLLSRHRPVVAGFDPKFGHYFLTFRPSTDGRLPLSGASVIFRTDNYRCVSNWDPVPEMYGYINRDFFIAGNKLLQQMYIGSIYCRWLGVQYTPSLELVFNAQPSMQKQPLNVRVNTLRAVYADSVTTSPGLEYPSGMASKIPLSHWQLRENSSWAYFLRDMNDPHIEFATIVSSAERQAAAATRGRLLKYTWLRCKIVFNLNSQQNYLTFAEVEFIPSHTTR